MWSPGRKAIDGWAVCIFGYSVSHRLFFGQLVSFRRVTTTRTRQKDPLGPFLTPCSPKPSGIIAFGSIQLPGTRTRAPICGTCIPQFSAILKRVARQRSVAASGLRAEVFLEFPLLVLVGVGVRRRGSFDRNVRPDFRELGVDLQPLAVRLVLAVRLDRIDRAFRFADATINALVRMDDE